MAGSGGILRRCGVVQGYLGQFRWHCTPRKRNSMVVLPVKIGNKGLQCVRGNVPTGLSSAIRLKQLNADLNIVVVEKGSEVGAHILSGAVIDPVALDKLVPEWRTDEDCLLKTQVTDDHFYWMKATGAVRLPNFMMPPLMNNHHCFTGLLGHLCRYLARKAEALGVGVYLGFAAVEVLYDDKGGVRG